MLTLAQERKALSVLAAIQFIHIVDFIIMMPLGPVLMREFSIGPQLFSVIVATYNISAGVVGLVAAPLVDRYDRRLVVLLALIGLIAGTVACGLAPNYISLLVARVIAGACGGLLNSQVLSIVGDIIPYERRGQATGLVMSSFSVASVAGVPIGLWLASQFNWHWPFIGLSIASSAVLALAWLWLPALRVHLQSGAPRVQLPELLRTTLSAPRERLALLFMCLLLFGQFLVIPFVSPAMVANVKLREDQLPLIYFFGGLLTVVTSPLVGRLSDIFSKTSVFTLFAVLNMIPCLVITLLGPTPLWVALTITTILFICANGRFVPATALVTAVVPSERRGGFMSLISTAQSLSAGLATAATGAIVSKGPGGEILGLPWAGLLSVLIGVAAIVIGRRLRPVS